MNRQFYPTPSFNELSQQEKNTYINGPSESFHSLIVKEKKQENTLDSITESSMKYLYPRNWKSRLAMHSILRIIKNQ